MSLKSANSEWFVMYIFPYIPVALHSGFAINLAKIGLDSFSTTKTKKNILSILFSNNRSQVPDNVLIKLFLVYFKNFVFNPRFNLVCEL